MELIPQISCQMKYNLDSWKPIVYDSQPWLLKTNIHKVSITGHCLPFGTSWYIFLNFFCHLCSWTLTYLHYCWDTMVCPQIPKTYSFFHAPGHHPYLVRFGCGFQPSPVHQSINYWLCLLKSSNITAHGHVLFLKSPIAPTAYITHWHLLFLILLPISYLPVRL
jgi:hypothetical protein